MKKSEKYPERFLATVSRTIITATLIAIILIFIHVFRYNGMSKLATFGLIWLVIFCIVFGGHWLELLFINRIKYMLPPNMLMFYLLRIIYWYLSAIPLFFIANWVGSSLSNDAINLGRWQLFGFFYIGIELFMHAIMQWRRKKSFYNGVY